MLEVTISKVRLASGSPVSLVKMNPSGSCKSQVGERKEAKWVEAEKEREMKSQQVLWPVREYTKC